MHVALHWAWFTGSSMSRRLACTALEACCHAKEAFHTLRKTVLTGSYWLHFCVGHGGVANRVLFCLWPTEALRSAAGEGWFPKLKFLSSCDTLEHTSHTSLHSMGLLVDHQHHFTDVLDSSQAALQLWKMAQVQLTAYCLCVLNIHLLYVIQYTVSILYAIHIQYILYIYTLWTWNSDRAWTSHSKPFT